VTYPRRILVNSFLLVMTLAPALSAQAPVQTRALDRANLDNAYPACQDFYQFANGGWLKRATIPAAYPEYGAFQQLADENEAVLHDILNTSVERVKSGQYKPGTGEWKVGTYYATCMDTTAIENLGWQPLKPDLDRINAISSIDDLKLAFGDLEKRDRSGAVVISAVVNRIAIDRQSDSGARLRTRAMPPTLSPDFIRAGCRFPMASITQRPIRLQQIFALNSRALSRIPSSCSAILRRARPTRRRQSSRSRHSSRKLRGRRLSFVMSWRTTTA